MRDVGTKLYTLILCVCVIMGRWASEAEREDARQGYGSRSLQEASSLVSINPALCGLETSAALLPLVLFSFCFN